MSPSPTCRALALHLPAHVPEGLIDIVESAQPAALDVLNLGLPRCRRALVILAALAP
jgi:hypothetical protein